MRNLKKILALVLALVMSLSLMATAGAADTTASGETITPAYQTAIDVLKGVEVFRGYEDGTIRPQNTITRAEVAAILYRIATGDVNDAKVSIYTDMANVNFTDLANANWAKGYINYCANAQLIVGMGDGTFKPQQNITGYATLAMVLRALGYDKNGEFKGSGWEIRTAAQARELGILKNVTSDLGSYATRELVSELLFRTILNETVTYSPMNQNLYLKTGKTLAKENLGLEEIEGVVVANEWANLYGSDVLGADTTELEVAENEIRTLKEGTELQDVGMSKLVYTQTDARNTYKVIKIADSGKNNVKENDGAELNISTASKFSAAAGMPAASDIEYYVNFDRTGKYTCDYRLEFSVSFSQTKDKNALQVREGFEATYVNGKDLIKDVGMTETKKGYDGKPGLPSEDAAYDIYTYSKIIRADETITNDDLAVIRGIFAAADNGENSNIYQGIDGYVYVGTKSNPNFANVSNDVSDSMSYRAFVKEYLNAETFDVNWDSAKNGEWVKFIDNDDDGYVDYAFKTQFTLDEIVSSYKKGDDTNYVFYGLNENIVTFDWLYDDVAVGDVVLTFTIDGVAHINKAEYDTDTVKTVNYKDVSITLDNGTTRYQSGITNSTKMPDDITDVNEQTEYNLYRDYFEYVRAYEETAGTQYALVTEAYFTNHNASAFVQNWPVTAEIAIGETSKTAVTAEEHNLVGGASNAFVSDVVWSTANNFRTGNLVADNYLQPATSGLGTKKLDYPNPNRVGTSYVYWNWNNKVMSQNVTNWLDDVGSAFDYGTQSLNGVKLADHSASFTNVARYTLNGDDVTLTSAAVARDSSDYYNVDYKIDYIQLSKKDVAKGDRQYDIGGTAAYQAANNYHVNAVHDTQYYIVSEDGIYYFTDYTNVPAITAEATKGIHAAYAVARDVNADKDDVPYWVADVIVYEVKNWDPAVKTSIALAYFLNSKTTGEVQYISALDNTTENPDVTIVPDNRYWTDVHSKGFYKVYDQKAEENNTLTASRITEITSGYNAEKIYASVADRVFDVNGRGDYIEVMKYIDDGMNRVELLPTVPQNITLSDSTVCYSITENSKGVGTANVLTVFDDYLSAGRKSDIQKGDALIWVLNDNKTAFVVNLGPVEDMYPTELIQTKDVKAKDTPDWLWNLWVDIMNEEQGAPADTTAWDVETGARLYTGEKYWEDGTHTPEYVEAPKDNKNVYGTVTGAATAVKVGSTVTVTATPAAGYAVKEVTVNGAGINIVVNGKVVETKPDNTSDVVLEANDDGTYTFTMGKSDAYVVATFEATTAPVEPTEVAVTINWTVTSQSGAELKLTTDAGKKVISDTKTIDLSEVNTLPKTGDFALLDETLYELKSVTAAGYTFDTATSTLSGGDFKAPITVEVLYAFKNTTPPTTPDDPFGGEYLDRMAGRVLAVGDDFRYGVWAVKDNTIQPKAVFDSVPAGLTIKEIEYQGTNVKGHEGQNYWIITFDTSKVSEADYAKYIDKATRTEAPKISYTTEAFVNPNPDKTLQQIKDEAIQAIEDAAAAAIKDNNLIAGKQKDVENLRDAAIKQIENPSVTSEVFINNVRDNAIANIQKVANPEFGLDDPTINHPIVLFGVIELKYYLPAGQSLTSGKLMELLNADYETPKFSLVEDTFQAEVLDPDETGSNLVEEAYAVVTDGSERYAVVTTHMYEVTIDGVRAGYVPAFNGRRDNNSVELAGVPANGKYLLDNTVSKGGTPNATSTNKGVLSMTTNYTPIAWTGTGYADRNFVSAHAVILNNGPDFVEKFSSTAVTPWWAVTAVPSAEYKNAPMKTTQVPFSGDELKSTYSETVGGTTYAGYPVFVQDNASVNVTFRVVQNNTTLAADPCLSWFETFVDGVGDRSTIDQSNGVNESNCPSVSIPAVTEDVTFGWKNGIQVFVRDSEGTWDNEADTAGVYRPSEAGKGVVLSDKTGLFTYYIHNPEKNFNVAYSGGYITGNGTQITKVSIQYVQTGVTMNVDGTLDLVPATVFNADSDFGQDVDVTYSYREIVDAPLTIAKRSVGGGDRYCLYTDSGASLDGTASGSSYFSVALGTTYTVAAKEGKTLDGVRVRFLNKNGTVLSDDVYLAEDGKVEFTFDQAAEGCFYEVNIIHLVDELTFTPGTDVGTMATLYNGQSAANTILEVAQDTLSDLVEDGSYKLTLDSLIYSENGKEITTTDADEILEKASANDTLTVTVTFTLSKWYAFGDNNEPITVADGFNLQSQTVDGDSVTATISWTLTETPVAP